MKPKSRTGKAGGAFAKTPRKAPAAKPAAGSSVDNKLTVILPPDQVAFLDRLCLDIRARTRAKIRRTELIRAMIGAVRDAGLDLTAHGSEAELAAALLKRLRR